MGTVTIYLFVLGVILMCCNASPLIETRPSVVFFGNDWADHSMVLHANTGSLYWSLTPRQNIPTNIREKTQWNKVDLPSGIECRSNPTSLRQSDNTTLAFFQSTTGQIFVNHVSSSYKFTEWKQVGGNLAYDEGANVKGFDSVVVKYFAGKVYVFARSVSNSSHFYWSSLDNKIVSSPWAMIGGSSAKLLTDATVAYNSFTKLLEAFMVSTDGYLYRSWQTSSTKWSSWDKTGWFAPKTTHAPVVHSMDTNMFNGRLNVFIHGDDGKLHHIWQTTCDKVPNPWGWCTWSTWNTIGDAMPQVDASVTNSISIGNNIHLGIEIFVVAKSGQLYKMWQDKRHGDWSNWELVKSTMGYHISSLPAIVNDGTGWWSAYALDASLNVLIVQQNRSLVLSPTSVPSGSVITVSWDMPIDEASNSDWIGILPNGGSNHFYVDYVYVGGSQNPMSQVIPSGKVSFTTYLPKGQYNVRYLVDKRYVAAVGAKLTITKGSVDPEWVQIFQGLLRGLEIKEVDVQKCVKDAEAIPEAFREALQDFENRAIFTGMGKLGIVVADVMKALKDCDLEKGFIKRVEVFSKDMASCISTKDCAHFVMDIGLEILVLYENIYEIYGDIIGASNSFKIDAYAQGGVNIGRVIGACIALPR